MNFQQVESITDFITNSFTNGRVIRELRLTEDELSYIKKAYPFAQIERLPSDTSSQKNWYRINIKPGLRNKTLIKL